MSEQSEALRLARLADRGGTQLPTNVRIAAELRRQHSRIEADEALMKDALSAMTTQYPWAEQGQKSQDEWAEKKDAAITALRARLEGEITATRSSPVVWTDTRETPNAS